MSITGKTSVYGIIGNPVEHSLSPVFQSYFARQAGMDSVYVPYLVQETDLATAMHGLTALGVQGLNVTVPHKEKILPYVSASAEVTAIGAANTLLRSNSSWQAYNTDWQGVEAVMQGTGLSIRGAYVLLFGAGGTARAVLHAAYQQGVARMGICNRSPERVHALIQHAKATYPDIQCDILDWHQQSVDLACEEANIIINTTSIGLHGDQRFPFILSGEGWAMDAVYHVSGATAFTQAASRGGRSVVDGLPMLIAQGARSFELWHAKIQLDVADALRWMVKILERDTLILPGWER